MVALSFLLKLNASDFDVTELRTIVLMFLAGGSAEGIGQIINVARKKERAPTDPIHPGWGMIRLGIYMGTLCLILWMNASDFDKTEGKTIMWMFVVGAGSEGLGQLLSRLQINIVPSGPETIDDP
jgi:hypothetical protein